jgi:isocitrate dehydrogenase kinase/phosphatase
MVTSKVRRLARVVLNGFDAYFAEFQNFTLGAQSRFERAEWEGGQRAGQLRLKRYKICVIETSEMVKDIVGNDILDRSLWREAKQQFSEIIETHRNQEIAQTFFNSLYGYIFKHEKIRDFHAFVFTPNNYRHKNKEHESDKIASVYVNDKGARSLISKLLEEFAFNIPYEDKQRDVERIYEVSKNVFAPNFINQEVEVEVLDSLFFRNKGAYLVGRVIAKSTQKQMPFALAFLNNEQGAVFVDTVLHDPKDLSILFSFARSFFMVDVSVPSQYVGFLQSLMSKKEVFELYNALGHNKHGKTEFYRSAVRHTKATPKDEKYIVAPGIPGMVMLVYTLPSYNYVYKIIKDNFTPPKNMTRQEVKEKYELVKRCDRVGRMADTQEFKNLVFKKSRFSEELLAELRAKAGSLITENENVLTLKHVYIERKMKPLNLFLNDASDEEIETVMDEYGNAIKQLAAANIFPGDMLLKNFGVTRHNRVVFYDYDEVCLLTECNFRKIPTPKNAYQEEQDMAGNVWYGVDENDIFPEEFSLFFSGNKKAQNAFEAKHKDLYDSEFWKSCQQDIRNGVFSDVFPYRRKMRFPR